MKRIFLLSYLLIYCGFLFDAQAQTKKLTMEDAIMGQWRQFYPQSLSQLGWQANSDTYAYVDNDELLTAKSGDKPDVILNLAQINEVLKSNDINELKSFPHFTWITNSTIQFYAENIYFRFNLEKKEIELKLQVNEKAENKKFCQKNDKIAYTLDNNLFVTGTNGKEIEVTNSTDKNIVNGQFVSRNEYGIEGGIFWSPKGEQLAFYRKDESKVSTFPLVDINTRVGKLREIKYPMAGMDSEEVSLGVYNLASGATSWIKPDDFGKDQYLTNISWGSAGKYIYIQVLNRASDHMKMNKYEAASGKFVKTLFEEKDDRWVEPQHKLIFLKNKDNQFIYQTNSLDGYNHLYLYDTEGKLIKQLTKGDWDVIKVLGFDKTEKNLFYMSTEVSPLERHAYKVNLKSGKRNRLTGSEGYHKVLVSADGKYMLDNYSSLNIPRIINLSDTKGNVIKQLVKAENKLADYNLGEISLGKIKAADDSTDLYYRMMKPANFDSSKKYPVVVYVYGGPHAQMVTNKWLGGTRLWEEYMAQNGYLMFILDNRGSANRGKEFEAVIHGQCGQAEMADQMRGIDFLRTLPYADMNRVGVHGWSYGGFMTISLITNYPDVFKVAVAGGPVIDWKWYEVMYGERYMDTPQENPEGYAKVSLISKAKYLKGKLLIIQGAIDHTVPWQNSLNFIRECIKNNVQVDYFPYPRAEHNVRGRDRIHLKQKVSNYFDDYLK